MGTRTKHINKIKLLNCGYSFGIIHDTLEDSIEFSREKKRWYFEYKKVLICSFCNNKEITFHHKNKEEKLISISDMVNDRYNFTIEDIKKELEKCIPVCRPHHDELEGIGM